MPTVTSVTPLACGDQHYYTATVNNSGLINVGAIPTATGYVSLGAIAITPGYVNTGTIGGVYSHNSHYAKPKNGDIEIDGVTLKAKIYDGELNKWIDCEIETMKNKNGKTKLEVTYDFSAKEEKERRNQRYVLFEKTKKPIIVSDVFINFNNIWHNFQVQPQYYYDVYGNENIIVGEAVDEVVPNTFMTTVGSNIPSITLQAGTTAVATGNLSVGANLA